MGISHLSYRLPERCVSLDELQESALVDSDATFLADIGFGRCFIQDDPSAFEDLVLDCGRDVLWQAQIPGDRVRWLLWYSGLEKNGSIPNGKNGSDMLHSFCYPVSRAQFKLGLPASAGLALSQQGCSGLLSAIFLAERLLRTTEAEAVLCLAGDALPGTAKREILYNVMSDAAAAVLVKKETVKNRIIHFHQQAVPYYWNTAERATEVLASYFPLAQRVILKTLQQADLSPADITWFVPHNVSLRSWTILAELLGISESRVWSRNIARVGHTVSCDHVINLYDMEASGALRRGDLLLLFTFGFGATWTCMILEH